MSLSTKHTSTSIPFGSLQALEHMELCRGYPNQQERTRHKSPDDAVPKKFPARRGGGERERKRSTEVAADDAVPGRAVVLVELLLNVLHDILLHGVLLECLVNKEKQKTISNRNPPNREQSESGRMELRGGRWGESSRYDAVDVEGLLAHLLLHVGALDLDLVPCKRRRRR